MKKGSNVIKKGGGEESREKGWEAVAIGQGKDACGLVQGSSSE